MAETSASALRLVSLLAKIRESLRKTLDAFRSKAFHGSLNEVLSISPEDINTAASYLVKIGLTREDGRQFCDEWERCWEEGGLLQVLVRNPPAALDYPASTDDWEPARVKQVNAERCADHQRKTDRQRGIAMDALSVLSAHVDGFIRIVNAMKIAAAKDRTNDNTESPPAPKTEPSEGNGGTDSTPGQPAPDANAKRKEVLKGLQPADRRAYFSLLYAERKVDKELKDHEAHKWLKENGIDTDKDDTEGLADYKLPTVSTWSRQVRKARQALGEQKCTRRAGRATGRSIVSEREIEYQNREAP